MILWVGGLALEILWPFLIGCEIYVRFTKSVMRTGLLGLMPILVLRAIDCAHQEVRAARLESRKSRRIERGQCIRCGYDMRATPEICPECGKFGPW